MSKIFSKMESLKLSSLRKEKVFLRRMMNYWRLRVLLAGLVLLAKRERPTSAIR